MKSLSSPPLVLLVSLVLPLLTATGATGHGDSLTGVTYDGRSLIINGKRDLLLSGSVHYPRSTPAMWPDIIMKAKEGGLNAIETYIFWNIHEPVYGKFNFEGRYDVVKFIKLAQANGMHVILRLGPFIQAEWNHGGLPYWLREVKNITFRTDNEPYKFHMERFAKMIVQKFKDEKLFAWQGGPIILAQIENEYNNIARAFEGSSRYIQWAAKMAVGLDIGVPWVMCKQNDAPGPVINACNGRNCGDTFRGPNHSNKPSLWTENWTDSGAYLEHRLSGLHTVVIQGLNAGTLDLSESVWGHEVGTTGEKLGIFNEKGVNTVRWEKAQSTDSAIVWYKRYFDAPSGNDPVAFDLTSMGKGLVWVNGEGIERYWVSYLSPLGKPSQSIYHVPRSILKAKDNLLVIFEEHGGKPEDIKIVTVKRDNICTFVSESQLGGAGDAKAEARLACVGGEKKVIQSVVFASFGNPGGSCGSYTVGSCHTRQAKAIAEKACLGKASCVLPISAEAYGADLKCQGTTATLAVQAKCARMSKKS